MPGLKPIQIFFSLLVIIGLGATIFARPWAQEAGNKGLALVVEIDGPIGPATVRHIENGIEEARTRNAEVLVLRINTPGGLVASTREIITLILESPVPVVGFVAPSGAHAASAGTYIMYATNIAVMAPGTNLGAATPVAIGAPSPGDPGPEENGEETEGDEKQPAPSNATALDRKSMNDAVAWIRSLAEMRGRNADWAESAVREAASLSASAALEANVIEYMAVDLEALLRAIDGQEVTVGNDTRALQTSSVTVVIFEPDFLTRILAIISNPNVALILMMIGVYGLFFEFANPGTIGPGIIGAISLILGLYALNQLPLNTTGVILIVLGIAFMVAEAFTPTMGALGGGGLVAFIFGAAMLIDTDVPEFRISWSVIIGTAIVSGATLIFLLGYIWRAQRRPLAAGAKQLLGHDVKVLEWSGSEGFVWAQGERWQARGTKTLRPGDKARVKGIEGLILVLGRGKKRKPEKKKKGD